MNTSLDERHEDAPGTEPIFYAGIGSRRTPHVVLNEMYRLARRLAALGLVLRSGAADGADLSFEAGCRDSGGRAEIWLPWRNFNGHSDTGFYPAPAHFEMAREIHPAWDYLRPPVRALHARNIGQCLGADRQTPVSFVVCWTPDGCELEASRTAKTGGTGTAIACASRHGIPVFNLCRPDAGERLDLWIGALQPGGHVGAAGGAQVLTQSFTGADRCQ